MRKRAISVIVLLFVFSLNFVFPQKSLASFGDYTGTSFSTVGVGTSTSAVVSDGSFFWVVDLSGDEVYKYNPDATYTGVHFDIAGSGNANSNGITFYNNFLWITDSTDAEVYKYQTDGTYLTSFDTAGSGAGNPVGITAYNDFFWIVDSTDDEVYKYNPDGTYASVSFDTSAAGVNLPSDILAYDNFFWITDDQDNAIYKYNPAGTYTGTSFSSIPSNTVTATIYHDNFFWIFDGFTEDLYKFNLDGTYASSYITFSPASNPKGIVFYNNFFWITESSDAEVYKFNPDGTYTGTSFDTITAGPPTGITAYNDFFWTTDNTSDEVYKFNPDGTYTGIHFDTAASGNDYPHGITTYNDFFWIADYVDSEVYKYNPDGTYTGTSFDTAGSGIVNLTGITAYNDFFWVVDSSGSEVYKFNPDGTYTGINFSTPSHPSPIDIVNYNNFFWIIYSSNVYQYEATDAVTPIISSLSPLDGATNVAGNVNLALTFNEEVVVGSGDVSIFKSSDDSLVEAIDVESGQVTGTTTTTITINPSVSLETGVSYYVQIDATAIDDLNGNSFAGIADETTWNFTVETTPPIVSSFSPLDNAVGVPVSNDLIITFDEAVDVQNGNITIYKSSDDSLVEAIDVTGGLVAGTGTTTITVNPTSNLNDNTGYYVQIDTTAFDDTAGNSFIGISDEITWNFTTAESVAPTVLIFSPVDGSINGVIDDNLVITFSEAVEVQSGNITIYKSSDDSEIEAIDVESGQVTGDGTDTITINPTSDLSENTEYYIQIDATAFDDTAGNSFAGIADEITWNFTTTFVPILIDSLSPADNSTDFDINLDDIFITFDESVEVGTGHVTVYKAEDDSVVEALDVTDTDYVEVDNPDVYFYLTEPLEADTEYYIKIDATAFDDTDGNSFTGIDDETTWNFRTYDDVNPTVTSLSPEDDDNNANKSNNLIITFVEAVNIDQGYITIYKSFDDSQLEEIDVTSEQVTGNGTETITINLNTGLDYSTDYYVFIGEDAFYDENDNYFGGISDESVWNFTTRNNITSTGSTRNVALPKTTPIVPLVPLHIDTPLPCTNGALFSNITGLPCSTNVEVNTNNTPQNEDSNKFIFTKNLWTPMIDPEVKELQKYLNTHGYLLAISGIGSTGNETNKFGNLTIQALKKFQIANGLKPDAVVGPKTREFLNSN